MPSARALTLRQPAGAAAPEVREPFPEALVAMAATAVTPHQRPESRWAEAVGRVVLARTATVRPAHPEPHSRGGPALPRWIPPMLQYN